MNFDAMKEIQIMKLYKVHKYGWVYKKQAFS